MINYLKNIKFNNLPPPQAPYLVSWEQIENYTSDGYFILIGKFYHKYWNKIDAYNHYNQLKDQLIK